ncbi:hypothetical protein LINPERHAP2_LOCUS34451 [Linum perenne]
MVAISLYRGNLHRVPDAPRRWLMPNRSISLRDFKSLLSRRSRALSRLTTSVVVVPTATATATTSNPNPDAKDGRIPPPVESPQLKDDKAGTNRDRGDEKGGPSAAATGGEDVKQEMKSDDEATRIVVENAEVAEKGAMEVVNGDGDSKAGMPETTAEPDPEAKDNAELSDKEAKRKKEVEERLEILNAKKHNLVQVLKQLLNVEEELKRRSSMQTMATRPSGPLQVEIPNDSGSTIRHLTPRMGSDANLGAERERVETDDVSNQNVHSRHLQRMSSTSPSSESPIRRPPPPYSLAAHPPRSSLGATSSPSRFAPPGQQQGHPANPPIISLSGTNYVPSSPSPAASGGTSAFRDARQPSPWN